MTTQQIAARSELMQVVFYTWKEHSILPSSLAKGYDPLYSSAPLASLDGFPSIIADIDLLWLSVNEFILNFSQIFAW